MSALSASNIEYPVIKVENPVYETMDKIVNQYWDNWLIVADWTSNPVGGKVLFYCKNRTDDLERLLDMLDDDPESSGFPDTVFVGPSRGFMGGVI